MATSVVSGRVDEAVRRRADAYIRGAGTTPAEVIKVVWENIARTGEVPTAGPAAQGADDPLAGLAKLRESFGRSEWLVNLSKDGLREAIASRYA